MKQNRLLENLSSKVKGDIVYRRYTLSDIISESYKAYYNCEENSNMQKIVEAHLSDVRNNPSDIDRLSRQLCKVRYLQTLVESNEMKDSELLVPEEYHTPVEPKEEEIKESNHDEEVEEKDDENLLDESTHDEDVEEKEDEDLLEETDLTDEEVEELTKHLSEIRNKKKVSECDRAVNNPEDRSTSIEDARKADYVLEESKTYEAVDLSQFSKNSSGKAFMKTLKKLEGKLKEGAALTRQESISLYKAGNSAMTHLSVELEHNPEFLETFKESVSLLSRDVSSVLESLKEGKAPSKSTMKSLAKFVEALLREEDEEELPPIEEEESSELSEEAEEFMQEYEESLEDAHQEYADAREEKHEELVDKYGDSGDPAVQETLAQDEAEVAALKGEEEEETPEEDPEESTEESEQEEEDLPIEEVSEEDDSDITEDELEELKRHLVEMRKAKKSK